MFKRKYSESVNYMPPSLPVKLLQNPVFEIILVFWKGMIKLEKIMLWNINKILEIDQYVEKRDTFNTS